MFYSFEISSDSCFLYKDIMFIIRKNYEICGYLVLNSTRLVFYVPRLQEILQCCEQ